jgi:hypothetical protein
MPACDGSVLAPGQVVRQRFNPCGLEFRELVQALGKPHPRPDAPNSPFAQWLGRQLAHMRTTHRTTRAMVVRTLAWQLVAAHPCRFAFVRDVLRLPEIARALPRFWTVHHAYKILLALCVWTPCRARIPFMPPMAGRSGMK